MPSDHALHSLTQLHLDVLIVLLEEVRCTHFESLRSLSATCRLLRQLSLPIIFRACVIVSRQSVTQRFLPIALWPFVRTLHLLDACPDQPVWKRRIGILNDRARLCSLYDPLFLSNALRNMPALVTVELGIKRPVEKCSVSSHGIHWSTIQAILSTPHLQNFALRSHRLAPWRLSGDPEIRLDSPFPVLTAFQYRFHAVQSQFRYRDEHQALAVILRAFHLTLRTLDLPIELLPIESLRFLEWPFLQELRFHGGQRFEKNLFFPSNNMALLRVLEINASDYFESDDQVPKPLWQRGLAERFPYQKLQRLSITFPCVEDALFTCLPPTLRELSLFCHPHKSLDQYSTFSEPDWTQNLQCASGLLRILQGCNLPSLRTLGIEYMQDAHEARLLQLICARFPGSLSWPSYATPTSALTRRPR